MAVIAIIGTLASIVGVSLDGARKRSRDAERVSEVAQIQLALETYYNACRQYPPTLTLSAATTGCTGVTLGTFLSKIPSPPGTTPSASYEYVAGTGNTSYTLRSQLETNDRVLLDDVDGVVTGLSGGCNEGVGSYMYCVKS